jgi:hypothetical protein
VMPSDTETLGFVVMEAMASGLPVVGVAAGGLLDIVQHGVTGYLAANPVDDDEGAARVDGERGRESGEVGDMGVAREAKEGEQEGEGEGSEAAMGAADQNGAGENGGGSGISSGSAGRGRSSDGDGMAEFAQYVSSLVGSAQSSCNNSRSSSNGSSSSSSSSEVQRRIAMGSAARSWAEEWSWETATSKLRNVQYRTAIARFKERHSS